MDHDDHWDDQVRDAYRRPITGEEPARERVIARLRQEPAPRRSRWQGWWTDPDAIHIRPLLAVATLIAAVGFGLWGGTWWALASRGAPLGSSPAGMVAEPSAAIREAGWTSVTFAFRAPGASRVYLVGDFNGWDPDATPLRRATLGDTWIAQVPLERGLHAYAFVIDGADWASDPSAPLTPEASFGRRNSLVVVGEEDPL